MPQTLFVQVFTFYLVEANAVLLGLKDVVA